MKKLIISMALLFLGILGLFGCTLPESEQEHTVDESLYHLYYVNAEETELITEAYTPSERNTQVMVTDLMHFLDTKEEKDGALPLLPPEVEVTMHTINDGTLTLDFNKAYLDMNHTRELLARAGIVKLFAQIPGIEYVKFSVEGKELEDSQGMPFSIMNADTFIEYFGEDINSYQYATITLYFTNKAGNALLPEERTVYYNNNIPLERVVIEQLMKGPTQEGLYPTLPGSITILGVTTDNVNCYLNLDGAFLSDALPIQEDIPIYSMVNSLVDACRVQNVQISINGETNLLFKESVDLNQFFKENSELIEKQK